MKRKREIHVLNGVGRVRGKTIETVGTAFVVSDSESRKFAATRSKTNGH